MLLSKRLRQLQNETAMLLASISEAENMAERILHGAIDEDLSEHWQGTTVARAIENLGDARSEIEDVLKDLGARLG